MSYDAVMKMPLRAFWLMNDNIDRISAKSDMRSMSIGMMSQSDAEQANEYRRQLIIETGTVIKLEDQEGTLGLVEPERDEGGFAELKMMARQ